MYGLELEKLGGDFKSLYYTVKSGRSAAVFSLNTGAKAHVISELDGKVLLIAPDRLSGILALNKDILKWFDNMKRVRPGWYIDVK